MRTPFNQLSHRSQLLLFFFFWVLCFLLFASLASLMMNDVFHLPPLNADSTVSVVNKYKWIQMVTSAGIFLLPPVLIIRLFTNRPANFLCLNKAPTIHTLILTFLMLFFSIPLLNLSIEWNQSLHLPESMAALESKIRALEDNAEVMTRRFLQTENVLDLFVNLFIIALIPALGEEFLFRGVVQQYFQKLMRNAHLAIWVSALIFSLLHFQFYGFLPRMLLGALFGYLFYWSGNLWVPVFAHFLNNGLAVIISYFSQGNSLQEKVDQLGTTDDFWYFTLPSTLLLLWMIRFFRKEQGQG